LFTSPGSHTSLLFWNPHFFKVNECINNCLTATDHVSSILASCSYLLYALRVLQSDGTAYINCYVCCGDGLQAQSRKDVFHATVIGKFMYCAPAWSDFCFVTDCKRHSSFLRRCEKLEYRERASPSFNEMFAQTDDCLFQRVLFNKDHLQQYLPQQCELSFSLRTQTHNLPLIPKQLSLMSNIFLSEHCTKTLINNYYVNHSTYLLFTARRISMTLMSFSQ